MTPILHSSSPLRLLKKRFNPHFPKASLLLI